MTRARSAALIIGACCIGVAACGAPAETVASNPPSLDEAFKRDAIVIESNDGLRHEFSVYLATEPEQQQRGLMFVRSLPDHTGMLFVYEENEIHSMWMKNTFISLDMVFAHDDGTVSSVIHNTVPLSLESQSSTEPVSYVLELPAGTARRFKIGGKSRIIWQASSD